MFHLSAGEIDKSNTECTEVHVYKIGLFTISSNPINAIRIRLESVFYIVMKAMQSKYKPIPNYF